METEQSFVSADESLDDLFDLDIRIYPVFDGEDGELLSTIQPASSAKACGTTSGCL